METEARQDNGLIVMVLVGIAALTTAAFIPVLVALVR